MKDQSLWLVYLVGTHFEEDIDIFIIFEKVFECDDVILVEGPMDFDLGHQLSIGKRKVSKGREGGAREPFAWLYSWSMMLCRLSSRHRFFWIPYHRTHNISQNLPTEARKSGTCSVR